MDNVKPNSTAGMSSISQELLFSDKDIYTRIQVYPNQKFYYPIVFFFKYFKYSIVPFPSSFTRFAYSIYTLYFNLMRSEVETCHKNIFSSFKIK